MTAITHADATALLTKLLRGISGDITWVDERVTPIQVMYREPLGDSGIRVTIWDADDPDDQGVDFLIDARPLGWCDDHRRHYVGPIRGMCDECVREQTAGDE